MAVMLQSSVCTVFRGLLGAPPESFDRRVLRILGVSQALNGRSLSSHILAEPTPPPLCKPQEIDPTHPCVGSDESDQTSPRSRKLTHPSSLTIK